MIDKKWSLLLLALLILIKVNLFFENITLNFVVCLSPKLNNFFSCKLFEIEKKKTTAQ